MYGGTAVFEADQLGLLVSAHVIFSIMGRMVWLSLYNWEPQQEKQNIDSEFLYFQQNKIVEWASVAALSNATATLTIGMGIKLAN